MGDFFVVPMQVGTPAKKKKKGASSGGSNDFLVKLDTASASTFVFGQSVKSGLQYFQEDFMRTDGDDGSYNYYRRDVGSTTYQPYIGKSGTRAQLFTRQYMFDGSVYAGVLAMDTVRVGGIKMKGVPFGIVDRRAATSIPPLIDVTGFDGALGLGLKDDPQGSPPIMDAMIRNSKPMKRTESFSLYICSDGQAGQLHLGGVETKKLLAKGSKLQYLPLQEVNGQYQFWAVKMASAKFGKKTIGDGRVAIIDSSSPYIFAPLADIQQLFFKDTRIQWTTPPLTANLNFGKRDQKPAPPPLQRYAPLVPCDQREKMGTLELKLDDRSATAVSFTGNDIVGQEAKDQKAYPGLCELFFAVSPGEEWHVGMPFLGKAGLTVFDRKKMRVGFGSAKHSDKICGKEDSKEENSRIKDV